MRTSWRYGVAVAAIGAGIVAATGHGVAWADTDHSDSAGSSASHAGPANNRASNGDVKRGTDRHGSRSGGLANPGARKNPGSGNATDAGSVKSTPSTGKTRLRTADPDSTGAAPSTIAPSDGVGVTSPPAAGSMPTVQISTDPETTISAAIEPEVPATDLVPRAASRNANPAVAKTGAVSSPTKFAPAVDLAAATPTGTLAATAPNPPIAALTLAPPTTRATSRVASVTTTPVDPITPTTPTPPGPLSPIAKILELPGRIINTVLQMLDITVSESGPKSPIDFTPISELLFAAFRGVEEVFGLNKPPAVQHVPPTLTYTGPTTALTPTVAQFLNASAAEYVLGGVPGGLVPLTVNGMQMKYTNLFTGAAAKAWVTPEQQVIIAYQGTTGGTNLLFKAVMAIPQILADLQVILTKSTPQAFIDSLNFAQQVRGVAAAQGYSPDAVFVTGHSLGGWEAQYVAQQTGLGGVGFEGPGLNTTVPGNGVGSNFVNIATYGDVAAYMSTDLPGLQPFMPPYVPGGGEKPHYGSIVMIGDPAAVWPLQNISTMWGPNLITNLIVMVDVLINFFQYHLPGVQAYHLGVNPDPGVVPWLGSRRGPVNEGWGDLTIQQLMAAASDSGALIKP